MKWIQYTTVAGEHKDPITRTEHEMLGIFAQVMFLKQAGEDNELHAHDVDRDYHVIEYSLTRRLKNYTVEYIFQRVNY